MDNHTNIESFLERRSSQRIAVSAAVQVRNFLKPGDSFAGTLSKDLCADGLKITSGTFFPYDTKLVMMIALPDGKKLIRVVGRVVWQRENRLNQSFDYGVQFVMVNPKDHERFASYVERGMIYKSAS